MKEKILIRIIAILLVSNGLLGLLLNPVQRYEEETVIYNFWPLYVFYLIIGIGLFFFKEWARKIEIGICLFFTVLFLFNVIFTGNPTLSNWVEIVICIFVMLILMQKSIKNQFQKSTNMQAMNRHAGITIGLIFKILAGIIFAIFGLWGFLIEISIINEVAGFAGVVIGFIILPVMFTVTPWYALAVWGDCHSMVCSCCMGRLVSVIDCLWRRNSGSNILWYWHYDIRRRLNL